MTQLEKDIARVRSAIKKLNLNIRQKFTSQEKSYFNYYSMAIPGARHSFGYLKAGKFKVAAHSYTPKSARASVLLVHGYLEHSCYYIHLIKELVKERLNVIALDLPGHGLSSGTPASIDNFKDYSNAVKKYYDFFKKKFKKPVYIVGHSMGCAAVITMLLEKPNEDFGKVVLAGPLVHPRRWILTNIAYNTLSKFASKAPRMIPTTSQDTDFVDFYLHRDPLHLNDIPLRWVESMLAWNKKIKMSTISATKIKIFQGTKDEVVSWRYNVGFLSAKFPRAEVVYIEDAFHQLFNELPQYRDHCISDIVSFLKGSK